MSKKEKTKQGHRQWVITVVFLSFGLSVVMSILTSVFVESAELLVALMTLIVLILIGIIGTAVTSASEQPFIAMASKRIPGAKQALRLIRRAERVSNLLNDVAGDIVSVVSGSAGSVIAVYLASMGMQAAVASVLITAFTSSFMIGGKACGKNFAIEKSSAIVLYVGKIMALFERGRKPKKKNAKNA